MSYLTQSQISINYPMRNRVAQCATSEGAPDPESWMSVNARVWSASPGWDDAWEYAVLTHESNAEYDPGTDETVITDGMILSQVQGMLRPPVVNPLAEPEEESTA